MYHANVHDVNEHMINVIIVVKQSETLCSTHCRLHGHLITFQCRKEMKVSNSHTIIQCTIFMSGNMIC